MPSSSPTRATSRSVEERLFSPLANSDCPTSASAAASTFDTPRRFFLPASHPVSSTHAVSGNAESPHPLALAPAAEKSSNSEDSNIPPVRFDTPAAPIDIPTSKTAFDAASTFAHVAPLTAREPRAGYFPVHDQHTKSKELSPTSALHARRRRPTSYFSDDSTSPSSSVDSTVSMHRKRPSSPLSPTAPPPVATISTSVQQSNSPKNRQSTARPTPNLRLNPLPRFHPANFETPSPSPNMTRQNPHSSPAKPHHRHVSDAQHKLQQYQRDVVAASAARAASLSMSPSATAKPNAPRLDPMGSPGPVTPLMLEPADDYLGAGTLGSPGSRPDRGRELVQRLVYKENERLRYSRRSESLSPAVSPAGGRG
ncbi:MAG: hypothetical protein Q9191_000440 [Dirinaria sp. TL-2023a]